MQPPYTYIDGKYVEATWDAQRKTWVFPTIRKEAA